MGSPSTPPPGFYIMSAYLRGVFDYLRARGAPLEPVLEVMGVSEADLRDPDRRIDHGLQNAIFDAAERVTGDVNVGLHAGEATHLMHFGIVGQLAMTCETVRDLVDLHSRFQGLISNGATMTYAARGDDVVGEVIFVDSVELSRHTLEYTLASHLTLARLMSGFPFTVGRIEVTYPEPLDCKEQQRVFGCPVRYGCEHERLFFPVELLDVPLIVGDSASRSALQIEARRRLDTLRLQVSEEEPELDNLKRFVADRLRGGPPTVDDAAGELGVSVRTLQRRLESRQLSFRDVIDLARREMAEKYMRDASLTQVDVAFLLGFTDQSAFHRAFRRWFEVTPKEYRAVMSARN